MTHELVHMAFPSVSRQHHWIEEGLATYVEPIARAQAGSLSAKRVWADMVRDMPQGQPGPQPPYPTNAPCWLVKGPASLWYTGNSPGQAVSIFFSDGKGGAFNKSISLPGTPTDITVSADGQWLAVIFTAADGSGGRIAVFSIDAFGDLSLTATSGPIGVASFNGVAFSQ